MIVIIFRKWELEEGWSGLLLNAIVGSNVITEEVVVSLPEEFGRNFSTMSVKLTDFNNGKFDCIIGDNILRPLGEKRDFQNEVIILNNDEIEVKIAI